VGERRRSVKAVANDELIRSSAINEIVRVGVDRLSLRDVGHAAGLTHGSTYARYEDVDELLIEVWNSTLRGRLVTMSTLSRRAAENPNADAVGELFEFLRHADARDIAAIEVLLVSRRIPALDEETEAFIQEHLETPDDSSATFTRGVVLFGVVMAHIFANAQFGFDTEYQSALEKLLTEVLGTTDSHSLLGESPAEHRPGPIPLSDRDRSPVNDNLKSKLTRATYDVVGNCGYVRATISRIARRSNCSPGAIYKFHRTKEDLIIGSFVDLMDAHRTNATDMARVLDEGYLTDVLSQEASDESELRRNFTLEMALAAGHCDSIRSIILNRLIEAEAHVPDSVVTDESLEQRLRYAHRMISTVVVAVSWLATLSDEISSFDMNSFAEPLRRGLVNQWFPDGADF
jgi:AcrR family transcriptional regulator